MLPSNYPPQESLLPQPVPRDFIDHTFLAGDGFELPIRVWPSRTLATSGPLLPWVFWIHGGAFCSGAHYAPPSWVVPAFRERGYHVVSTSYRLAPYANLEMILGDCRSGIEWARRKLPLFLDNFDSGALVIGGDSAGGTLALLLTHLLLPSVAPRAVVDVYGLTDFTAYDTDPRALPPSLLPTLHVPLITAPFPWEIAHISEQFTQQRWAATEFTYTPAVRAQTAVADTLKTSGQIANALMGLRATDTPHRRRQTLANLSPINLVDSRHDHPPVAFLHGQGDEMVPWTHSALFADKLRKKGVKVYEGYEPDMPHAFDQLYVVSCNSGLRGH